MCLVQIYLLIGLRNRLAVFVNWTWSWITYGRGARLITGRLRSAGARRIAEDGSVRADRIRAR